MDFNSIADQTIASQDKWELAQLLWLLWRSRPLERILEIGVHTGGMLQTLGQAFPEAELIGIDNDFNYLEFEGFTRINGDSTDPEVVSHARDHGPYDLIFIDGDHTYAGVKADWDNYHDRVNPGGVIAFHDTMRQPGQIEGVEVRQLFDELKEIYPSVEIWNGKLGKGAPGIGVIFS